MKKGRQKREGGEGRKGKGEKKRGGGRKEGHLFPQPSVLSMKWHNTSLSGLDRCELRFITLLRVSKVKAPAV